jgi:hypothetical protein
LNPIEKMEGQVSELAGENIGSDRVPVYKILSNGTLNSNNKIILSLI